MMQQALVSVLIPAFRMGEFIGEALESVGSQTWRDWEVIVVDDAGPEDGTRGAVQKFAAENPGRRVEYIRHGSNSGVSVARRTAFEAARGKYVAFLDADDAYLPEKLARDMAALEAHPDCVLAHGRAVGVGVRPEHESGPEEWFKLWDVSKPYDCREVERFGSINHICNSTVVAVKSAIQRDDFARQMLFQFEDWFLWMLLRMRGRFYYQNEPLTKYRLHPGSFMSSAKWGRGAREFGMLELMLAVFPHLQNGKERREAAKVMIDNLQILMSSRSALGASPSRRWGLKLRWALLTAVLSSEWSRFRKRLCGR